MWIGLVFKEEYLLEAGWIYEDYLLSDSVHDSIDI